MNTLVNIHDSFIVDGASARENVSPQKGISGTPMSFEYQRMSAFIKNMHPREEIIYVGMKSLAFNFLTKSQARSEWCIISCYTIMYSFGTDLVAFDTNEGISSMSRIQMAKREAMAAMEGVSIGKSTITVASSNSINGIPYILACEETSTS